MYVTRNCTLPKIACENHLDLSERFACFDHFSQFQTLPLLTRSQETLHLIVIFTFGIGFCNFSFPTKAYRAFLSLQISRKSSQYNDSVGLKQGS